MIPAKKSRLADAAFGPINRRMLRRAFHAVRISGREHIEKLDRRRPIILAANHSCWWDGLLAYYLSRDVFGFDQYAMMEERQFLRYRFFRWIGAFSVNRESPRDGVAAIRYAVSVFDTPGRVLWIYPQGVMRPNDARPLAFYPGIARIIDILGGAQVVPVAHRYEFLREQRPDALTAFGAPIDVPAHGEPAACTRAIEDTVRELLDGLRCSITNGTTGGFETVLHGGASTNILYDRARMKKEGS